MTHRFTHIIMVFLVLSISLTSCTHSSGIVIQPVDTGSMDKVYDAFWFNNNKGPTIPYRLLKPEKYAGRHPKKGYPLVVFLHGIGERGNDNKAQLKWCADYFARWQGQYPMYVLFPQCDTDFYWTLPQRPTPFDADLMPCFDNTNYLYPVLLKLIQNVVENNDIDPDRIVLAGFSMGAVASLDIGWRQAARFAGVCAIAGAANRSRAPYLAKTSIWLEHCADDPSMPVATARALAKELAVMGADVVYNEHPEGGHAGFHLLKDDKFMKWIFTRQRH